VDAVKFSKGRGTVNDHQQVPQKKEENIAIKSLAERDIEAVAHKIVHLKVVAAVSVPNVADLLEFCLPSTVKSAVSNFLGVLCFGVIPRESEPRSKHFGGL
jgi:hypothetical protein